MPADQPAANTGAIDATLWALIAVYAGATLLPLFPGLVPWQFVVAAHIVPTALFALVHGARIYRLQGILIFALLSVAIGNIFENIGVLTGFPFGHYYFTERMGPRVFQVPALMGPAYLGMGYLSWTLARLILDNWRAPFGGKRVVTLPLIASFIMVAWDLSIDPVLSTQTQYWVWQSGGPYFGVPLSNFAGWYLTNYVIYQAFALYQLRRPLAFRMQPRAYWRLPVILYAIVAMGNILRLIPISGPTVVSDAAGVQWSVKAINGASALASLFIMGAFTLFAWQAGARSQEAEVRSQKAAAATSFAGVDSRRDRT